jgi:two-component system, OmpR family, heavy metal sensor histidine kinase CusS
MFERRSLTARLTALYTLVSALVLMGMGVLVAQATERHFVELDRDYLRDKIGLIQKIIRETGPGEPSLRQLSSVLASHHGLFIELRQGEQVVFATREGVFPPSVRSVNASSITTDWRLGEQTLRGMNATVDVPTAPAPSMSSDPPIQVMVALDTAHHMHFMSSLIQTLVLYLLAAIVFSGLLGWWAARSGLSPLRTMKERALGVTGQRLDQRMPVEAVPVEFADLAQSLNTMLARLQADFARLQEFSSDLAHELRTPINNLLTQTQVSLTQKRDASVYEDILASNAEEFQRLARMVSDMLFLAKTEHGIELPNPEAISLDQETRELFEFYDAVADEKRIRLSLTGHAVIMGDRLMVRRAIGNLLSNALRHSPADAEVAVQIKQQGADTSLCFTNSGPTIPPDVLPRLFDRFFRVDQSRSHPASDGAGLGLSITQAIMTAHGGSVTASSSHGITTFCLVFPGAVAD